MLRLCYGYAMLCYAKGTTKPQAEKLNIVPNGTLTLTHGMALIRSDHTFRMIPPGRLLYRYEYRYYCAGSHLTSR